MAQQKQIVKEKHDVLTEKISQTYASFGVRQAVPDTHTIKKQKELKKKLSSLQTEALREYAIAKDNNDYTLAEEILDTWNIDMYETRVYMDY